MKKKPLKYPWSIIGEDGFNRLFNRLVREGFTTENMRGKYRRAQIGPSPMERIENITRGKITIVALRKLKRGGDGK